MKTAPYIGSALATAARRCEYFARKASEATNDATRKEWERFASLRAEWIIGEIRHAYTKRVGRT